MAEGGVGSTEIIELKLYTNCFMNMDFVTHKSSRRVTRVWWFCAACRRSWKRPESDGARTSPAVILKINIGWWADGVSRKRSLFGSTAWWSSCVMFTGLCSCVRRSRIHHFFYSREFLSFHSLKVDAMFWLGGVSSNRRHFFVPSTRCLITGRIIFFRCCCYHLSNANLTWVLTADGCLFVGAVGYMPLLGRFKFRFTVLC